MKKVERIDSVRNPVHDEAEVRRRLPEVDAIYDEHIREEVIDYFIDWCPAYFWERPASSSGKYHPPDERDRHGLWLHTKRVFAAYANLSESYVEAGFISDHQRECGKAAALIHDTFQEGWPSAQEDYGTDHDVLAAEVVAVKTKLPAEVVHLVHRHMGPWGEGHLPHTDNDKLFHLADKSASDSAHTPAVYFPAEELVEAVPDLETIEVKENEFI